MGSVRRRSIVGKTDKKIKTLLISPSHGEEAGALPWGVLALASYLTNTCGYDVDLLDADEWEPQTFRAVIKNKLDDVDLVGIGCFTTDIYEVRQLIDWIRQSKPHVKLIVGGPHAILEPEQTCRYTHIDFVAYTDGEQTMARLIEELARPDPALNSVPGLIYKTGKQIVRTSPPSFVGFYNIRYDLLSEQRQKSFSQYIQVLTGRGCSYRCRFCYNSVICQRFHPRPVSEIVSELKDLVARYDPEIVYFRDDNFFQIKERILDFIRLYREAGFRFRWRATCRANYFRENYLNSAFIRQLEQINCETLKLGIESGSQRILDYLRKGIRLEQVHQAVDTLSQSSIKGNYSFMIGLPTQTFEEYKDTLRLIRSILQREPRADIIGPQYFRVYPGGSLYEEIIRNYDFQTPESFEQWSEYTNPCKDPMGLFKSQGYPWISQKDRTLARHADLLVQLYRKPWNEFLSISTVPALGFALWAKIRMRKEWFSGLLDVRLAAWLYRYRQRLSTTHQPDMP